MPSARDNHDVGRHCTRDLAVYFLAGMDDKSVGIERSEFDHACDRLVAAGYELQNRDEAWLRFSDLRATYATHLNELARLFAIPPIAWIGDRSAITLSPHL